MVVTDPPEMLPSPEQEWQPIETAPKDGTPILVCGGHDDNAIYADEKYAAFMRLPCRVMWDGNSWLATLTEACCCSVSYENPTYWMPLPKPPSRAA